MPPRAQPLPGPRGLENLSRVRQLFEDPATALDGLCETYGPICGLRLGPARIAIIGDPELLHAMFAMPADSFRWGHKFNMVGVRFVVGRRSMIVSDGADHHRRRGSVQSAFTRRRLNTWIPMIVDRADRAIGDLIRDIETSAAKTGETEIDLSPVIQRLILGITLHAFFGEDLVARADEIGVMYGRMQKFIEAVAVKQLPHPIPFSARSRVRSDRHAVDEVIDAEIAKRRAHPTGDPFDILEAIIIDGALSDPEIRDQVKTLIGAGYDTTSAALAWMLWCATLTSGVWSRIRAEADALLGEPDGCSDVADHATLARLEFTQRVVHESLRLHPAGLVGARAAGTDVRLGDYTIRKGTLIVWSPHLAGRDPGAWADPLRFDPDRFADLTPQQKVISDQAWVPFGRGPHMCIGFALAQMELTLILARIAQRLDLTPTSSEVPRPIGMVVNRPIGGAPFTVAARGR